MKRLIIVFAIWMMSAAMTALADEPMLVIDPQGHSALIQDLIFTPDGAQLISVSDDKTIRVWDAESGDLLRTLRGWMGAGPEGGLNAVALSSDPQFLFVGGFLDRFTGGRNGDIRILAFETGEQIGILQGHSDTVNKLSISGDGRWMASASFDTTVRIWDLDMVRKNAAQKPFIIQPTLTLQGHEAVVHDVAFAPDGQQLVSASEDQTLRVWQLAKNKASVISSTVLKQHKTKVHCVTYSPDGKYFASGDFQHQVFLWDHTGKLLKKIDTLANEVESLAFSPDSALLFAGSRASGKFYQIPTGKQQQSFPQQEQSYFYTARFHPTQNLIAAVDGVAQQILLYDTVSKRVKTQLAGKGQSLWSLAFGKGLTIAFGRQNTAPSGFDQPPQTAPQYFPLDHAFNLADMTFYYNPPSEKEFSRAQTTFQSKALKRTSDYTLQIQGGATIENRRGTSGEGKIWSYTFTPDGNVAVGGDFGVKLYRPDGLVLRELFGHTSGVYALAVSEDGRILASASHDQTIKFWNLADEGVFPSVLEWMTDPSWAEYLQEEELEQLARKNSRAAWEAIIKELQQREKFPSVLEHFTDPSWANYFREQGLERLALENSRAAWESIIKKMKTAKDNDYKLLQEELDTFEEENYKILQKELEDVSPRIAPLATLFVASDNEWVCWTPQGYYAASAGGEKYIGWHINQGLDAAAQYHPVSVFRKQFLHPELVQQVLVTGGFEQALREINRDAKQEISKVAVTDILPPTVQWLTPRERTTDTDQAAIRIKVKITSGSEISDMKILVNGRTQAARGLSMIAETPRSGREHVFEQEVTLTPGQNTITVFASNQHAGATSEERSVNYQESEWMKPNLYMVSIGISDYERLDLQLQFADDDAQAISELFRSQTGKLYQTVNIKELYNTEATRANILDALEWLEKQTTQKDVAVMFVASHGVNDERGNFYLLPADGNPEKLRQTGVDWADFRDILGNLPSKVLMFLDTCHSGQLGKNLFTLRGQVDNTEAIRELASDENGVVILAASTGKEFSMEHPEWGHGAFTKSLLNGLRDGNADLNGDGVIHLNELDYYVAEQVKALTGGAQHPTTLKPSTISRFPIVQVGE
ncbi:WD-40 repeat protein [Candidatus Vecturithrix granuli]|uniref:WD-40 repeat protein n=1 Tax=Vecturithrix granuli TaxID=1499967 RepID=A0A081BXE2_VECG1|nr:WD-40 repeat protein [Candidatus Vecturithrix granuli]